MNVGLLGSVAGQISDERFTYMNLAFLLLLLQGHQKDQK